MTQKLTLPIQVGKKYIRRDGQVVTTTPGVGLKTVGVGNGNFVWEEHGKVWLNNQDTALVDLIADYIEPAPAHPHAEAMMEYAKDAATMAEPWKNWEIRYNKSEGTGWHNCVDHPAWNIEYQYRRKQPKLTINGIECVAGVKEPVFDELYYVASITHHEYCLSIRYAEVYKTYTERGLVHRTKEEAIAMAKAMFNF